MRESFFIKKSLKWSLTGSKPKVIHFSVHNDEHKHKHTQRGKINIWTAAESRSKGFFQDAVCSVATSKKQTQTCFFHFSKWDEKSLLVNLVQVGFTLNTSEST